MEYNMKCGCSVEVTNDTLHATILYCPKHKAADDMYAVLKRFEQIAIHSGQFTPPDLLIACGISLAKADGN